ncbi:O-linked glcnac transferase [Fusobacterium polymorphum]|uniref:O-linked glcnac transferase n=1 Tax=Fusobacterium nucleatum subsp. polymorphum TaxID=76857 RepID=A0A2B7YFU9_FUSNP|nr:tetratricopeptide repeat protein [Fusobacterium polymorphum]PGH20155.1 O-linked glcnac transferase [Fusobacterium polymorphum]
MKKELLEKIERLDELWKYQEIIDLIEALPTEQLDTELIGELGKAYNNIENYEKGLKILKSIENEEGDNALWNWRVGYSYFFLKDYIKAEKYFLKAYELEPNDEYARDFACDFLIGTYTALSKLESRNGNSEKAIEYALESRKYAYDEEGRVETDFFLASLYNRYMKYAEAEEILKYILAETQKDEERLFELVYCLFKQEKYEEVIQRLNHTLEVEDKENEKEIVYIYSLLVWCYHQLGDYEKALEYQIKFKEKAHSQIGYQLGYDPKKVEEVLEHSDRAIELERNDTWFFEVKGVILLDTGRYEEALDLFKKAYELANHGWYLYSMGRCLRNLERYEEAIKVLLESRQISLDKNDVVDGEDFELAYCYIGIGDKEKAQKYLDSARDSVTQRGALNDYMKEKIEEIEKGILSLNQFLN